MSTTIEKLNKIKSLLGVEVKMEQLKLENGTLLEADKFEGGNSVFIVTEDEKVPLPSGEYQLEDNKQLTVEQEGIIARIESVELAPEDEESRDDGKEAAVDDWQGMEKRIKNLEDAVADLKRDKESKEEAEENDGSKIIEETEDLKTEEQELKEELSKPAVDAIKHAPVESTRSTNLNNESFKYASSTYERVVARINNINRK
jgi:hypothetical protein